jgi:hypothetical protein
MAIFCDKRFTGSTTSEENLSPGNDRTSLEKAISKIHETFRKEKPFSPVLCKLYFTHQILKIINHAKSISIYY